MQALKLSPKYQVVIPKEIRENLALKPGQDMQVFEFAGAIQIVPVQPLSALRGFAAGMNAEIDPEPERF